MGIFLRLGLEFLLGLMGSGLDIKIGNNYVRMLFMKIIYGIVELRYIY